MIGRGTGLVVALAAVVLLAALSISVGARGIPLDRVWTSLFGGGSGGEASIVRELRLPRTLLALEVGAALGVAGALMQALTRNPLADPGLLGVNAGAAAAMVLGTAVLGTTQVTSAIWFAFAGAAAASLLVYALGATGRSGATPIRLALAGAAVTAAISSFVSAMVLLDPQVLDAYRTWAVGSLSGRDPGVAYQVAGFIAAGLVLALALARPLNALALGDEAGKALGANLGRTRALGALAVVLLCGAATAAAGPIAFIGLTVPHVARAIAGPDQRWVLPYSLLLAPALLLTADVVGRVIDKPGEVQAGLVCAALGAPVFIALVRRARLPQL